MDALYEYLRVLASHQVKPLIVPPDPVHSIILKVKQDIRTNPGLELPDDPDRNIWTYCSIMRVTPILLDDFLLVILTLPLINRSLQMDLYMIQNLAALHPDLGIQFSYTWKGQYLTISMHDLYAEIPMVHDIRICIATE